MSNPLVIPGPLDHLLGTGRAACRVLSPNVTVHWYPESAAGVPCLCGAERWQTEMIVCETGCTFADAAELEEAWRDMVIDAAKANGEAVPDILNTPARDIFQCPRCHAMIPAHER